MDFIKIMRRAQYAHILTTMPGLGHRVMVYFVPDIPAAIPELWRNLRTCGKLVITTWVPDFFKPANSVFWNAVRYVKPELYKGFNSWDRISEPSTLSEIFIVAGLPEPLIVAEQGTHSIASAED